MILAYRGRSLPSWYIKVSTLSRYSHVSKLKNRTLGETGKSLRHVINSYASTMSAQEYRDGFFLPHDLQEAVIASGCLECWQNGDGCVERSSLREGHKAGTVIDLYDMPDLTDEQLDAIDEEMRRHLGKGYWWGGLLLIKLARFWAQQPEFDAHGEPKKFFCSFYIEWCARRAARWSSVEWNVPEHGVAPGTLTRSLATRYVGSIVL